MRFVIKKANSKKYKTIPSDVAVNILINKKIATRKPNIVETSTLIHASDDFINRIIK